MKSPSLVLVASLLVSSNLARAQDDAALGEAYQRAAQGLTEFKSGHYAEALEDYGRAFAIVKLPALAVHMARANVKLGRYKAAYDLYTQATKLGDGVGDPEIQARARTEARLEQDSLLPRMPKVFIRISGVVGSEVSVSVDATPVQKNAYESGWLVDPGTHHVIASRGSQRFEQWVALTDSQSRELNFTFNGGSLQTTSPRPQGPSSSVQPVRSSAMRKAAWVSLGVGGTGLLVWGTAGLVALSKSNHLKSLNCGGPLPPCPQDGISSYNTWKTVSTVGFYTGTTALLTAAAFYFAEPSEKKSRDAAARVIPWVAFGTAGVEGQF